MDDDDEYEIYMDGEDNSEEGSDGEERSESGSEKSAEEDESYYCEPWEVVLETVHLAAFAKEIVEPLCMASGQTTQKSSTEKKKKKRNKKSPKASSSPKKTRARKSSLSSSSVKTTPFPSNKESRGKLSPGMTEVAADEEDEEDEVEECQNITDWDSTYLTVSSSSISMKGLRHLHGNSASAAYTITVPSDATDRFLWVWTRVCLPDRNPYTHSFQFSIDEIWHNHPWNLKTSIAEASYWHWQRYPHTIDTRNFLGNMAQLRISFGTMESRLSALWLTFDPLKTPPGFEKDLEVPRHVLHCVPNMNVATYDAKRPWTAYRVPDTCHAKNRLRDYQFFVAGFSESIREDLAREEELATANAKRELDKEKKKAMSEKVTRAKLEKMATSFRRINESHKPVTKEDKIFQFSEDTLKVELKIPKFATTQDLLEDLSEEDSENETLSDKQDDEDSNPSDEEQEEEDPAAQAERERRARLERWKEHFDDVINLLNDNDRAMVDGTFETQVRLVKLQRVEQIKQREEEEASPVAESIVGAKLQAAQDVGTATKEFNSALIFGSIQEKFNQVQLDHHQHDD